MNETNADSSLLVQATLLSQDDGTPKNDLVVLSDWPETLYQELHHPQNKPFICFYSINVNYFVSLNWVEPHSTQMQVKVPHLLFHPSFLIHFTSYPNCPHLGMMRMILS